MDLSELESRLQVSLPRAYKEFVQSLSAQALLASGFDPKTLLVLNLQLRTWDHDGFTQGRFFLNGDGCGNYYFVELMPEATKILLWSHDPAGIEDAEQGISSYLRDAEQIFRIDGPPPRARLSICRTPAHWESILQPIGLDEWVAAVEATPGIEHVGRYEGVNPFTREAMYFQAPGLARAMSAGETYQVDFIHGRAELPDKSQLRPIATALGEKLAARVLIGSD